MNNQNQHRFTTNEWWSTKTNRAALWRNFLCQNVPISWELEYWFYWMAYFMKPQLQDITTALEKAPTKDARYLDQIQQMATFVNDLLYKCRCVLTAQQSRCFCDVRFPCRIYRDRFKCYCSNWRMIQVGCIKMCENAKFALVEDVMEVMNAFMAEWLYEYYYVWKLSTQGRLHFPIVVNINPMSLSDIRLWEVVCEDDDKQILSHPLLPHPSDFLEKCMVDKTSTLYVDKARFEYEIPGSLSKYSVVLSYQRSIIPRMAPASLYSEEKPSKEEKQQPTTPQVLYTESTTAHKNGRQQHKKRRLSKILKEGRKKNKTLWIRRRHAKNPLRQMSQVEEGEDYDDGCYHNYYYAFSESSSEYDRYDYNDYDYGEW